MTDKKEILKVLADNPALTEAVKEVIAGYFSVDNLESGESDITLGQMVRARLVGLKAVNDAFREIEQYKSTKPTPKKDNPAY